MPFSLPQPGFSSQRFSFQFFPKRPSFRPAFQRVSKLFKPKLLQAIGLGRPVVLSSGFPFSIGFSAFSLTASPENDRSLTS
jgi:hypothetical protein